MRRHCVWVKDDDCGTLAESAAAPAADRESVTSKQSGGLRGSRSDTVCNLDVRQFTPQMTSQKRANLIVRGNAFLEAAEASHLIPLIA